MAQSLLEKSILQVIQSLKNGTISSHELLTSCYKRINKIKCLNAFITVVPEDTTKIILKKDGLRSSILQGIPYSIKDNFSTKNIRTTCASNMLRDYFPAYDSTVVKKLSLSGGVLIGKTNLDEFAMGSGSVDSIFGPVRNPWNYDFSCEEANDNWCVAGGSSGGSAVAVATGASFFALGSDTGGSVRIPAAFCGVVGLKPTYGEISRHGLISLVNSMDVPGIFTKNVEDSAFVFNLLRGHDPRDSTTLRHKQPPACINEVEDVKNLVIGIPREYHGPELSSEVLESWNDAANTFSNAGAKVVQVSLPHTPYAIVCYHVLCCGEVASNMSRFDGLQYGHRAPGSFTEEMYAQSRNEGFNEMVKGRIMAGNYFLLRDQYATYYDKAMRVRRLISNDFRTVFDQGVDVILAPTTISIAPSYNDFISSQPHSRYDIYTQAANIAGVPAISIPVRLSRDRLPISLQLITDHFKDETLLKVSKFLENESNFPIFVFK